MWRIWLNFSDQTKARCTIPEKLLKNYKSAPHIGTWTENYSLRKSQIPFDFRVDAMYFSQFWYLRSSLAQTKLKCHSVSFWLHECRGELKGWARKPVNHASWATKVTPTDRLVVSSRCVIKHFDDYFLPPSPANKVWGGVGITLCVCLSVRPSVHIVSRS